MHSSYLQPWRQFGNKLEKYSINWLPWLHVGMLKKVQKITFPESSQAVSNIHGIISGTSGWSMCIYTGLTMLPAMRTLHTCNWRGRLCSCLYLHFPPKKSAKKSSSLTVNFNTTFPLEFWFHSEILATADCANFDKKVTPWKLRCLQYGMQHAHRTERPWKKF